MFNNLKACQSVSNCSLCPELSWFGVYSSFVIVKLLFSYNLMLHLEL